MQELLNKCKTDKQVLDLIKKSGRKIVKDDTKDLGTFSVWISSRERIYKSRRGYIFQKWSPVTMKYSGIPTFFG